MQTHLDGCVLNMQFEVVAIVLLMAQRKLIPSLLCYCSPVYHAFLQDVSEQYSNPASFTSTDDKPPTNYFVLSSVVLSV